LVLLLFEIIDDSLDDSCQPYETADRQNRPCNLWAGVGQLTEDKGNINDVKLEKSDDAEEEGQQGNNHR